MRSGVLNQFVLITTIQPLSVPKPHSEYGTISIFVPIETIVLDEATSAVDPALEVQIRRAIERLTAGRTSITVAHRLSTAEAADTVLVFDEGRLVESGPHAELVTTGGVYSELHRDWEGSVAR